MNITISENKRYFKKNNKKFFYFADTCWSAFTNIDLDSWEYYLQYRNHSKRTMMVFMITFILNKNIFNMQEKCVREQKNLDLNWL